MKKRMARILRKGWRSEKVRMERKPSKEESQLEMERWIAESEVE